MRKTKNLPKLWTEYSVQFLGKLLVFLFGKFNNYEELGMEMGSLDIELDNQTAKHNI